MIERYVFVRLKSEFCNDESRGEVAAETLKRLAGLPGVERLAVGIAADEPAQNAWDLSIVVTFGQLEEVRAYLDHPTHRAYVDEYLKPRMEVIKYWNFDTGEWHRVPRPD